MQKTANYSLNKPEYNNVADIVPAVDENMDIIDKTMGDLQDSIDTLEDALNDINLDAANVSFTSSIAAFSQLGKNKVNLALDYLFQLANNGKQYWVDVVGIPLLVTDTFATLKSKTQAIKNTIATNIASKGVSANNTDSLTSLADAISRITIEGMGGKRIKTGTVHVTTGNAYVELGFKPSFVAVIFSRELDICNTILGNFNGIWLDHDTGLSSPLYGGDHAPTAITINQSGFTKPVRTDTWGSDLNYIAF